MSVFIDRSLVQRILLIKLRGIGDVLPSTVVAGNLRRAFPEARIDFLTEPSAVDVLQGNPHIDRIVVYDRAMMSGAAFIQRVRSDAYDLVIDLFGNLRTALVARLSRARYRVG
jgi:ADP-heptose:LPS heptosyltransferase